MRFDSPPGHWSVTLKSGSVIEIRAHTYTEENGHYLFCSFVHASPEEEGELEVANPDRAPGSVVIAVLARVPAVAVESVEGSIAGPADLHTEGPAGAPPE